MNRIVNARNKTTTISAINVTSREVGIEKEIERGYSGIECGFIAYIRRGNVLDFWADLPSLLYANNINFLLFTGLNS